MERIKRIVIWFLINGLACCGLYLSFWKENTGVQNILKFFIIVLFILQVILAFSKEIKKEALKKGCAVDKSFNFIYDLIFTGVLVYFGWLGYATFYVIHAFLQLSLYCKDKKNNEPGNEVIEPLRKGER